MKVWIYCSYAGSQAGFRLGCVDSAATSEEIMSCTPHKLVDRCFSYQGISRAYGKIPGTDSYVFIRPIERQAGDIAILNFGFETDNYVEFEKIQSYFAKYDTSQSGENKRRKREGIRSTEEDELYNKLRPIIIEAYDNLEFGLRVDRKYLSSFLDEISACEWTERDSEYFYLQSRTEVDVDVLASNMGLASILGGGYLLKQMKAIGSASTYIIEQNTDTTKKLDNHGKATQTTDIKKLGLLFFPVILVIIYLIINGNNS